MENIDQIQFNSLQNAVKPHPLFPALPEFSAYLDMDNAALWLELQRAFPTGYKLSNALAYLPASLVSRTGKIIAGCIANKVNPSHTGVCYASRKTIAQEAEVSIATLDRFTTSNAGRAIFNSEIPQGTIGTETARRTLTRPAMLFCLAIFLYRKTVSRLKQKVMMFALKAASALIVIKEGGRKTKRGTGAQNEAQKEIVTALSEREKNPNSAPEPSQVVDKPDQVYQGKTLAEWNALITATRIQGQLNAAEERYNQRQGNEINQLKSMMLKVLSAFKTTGNGKNDTVFRESFAGVDYGKIPKGFRGYQE